MRYCHFIFLLFFSMFSIFCKAQTDRQLIRKGNREFQKKNYVNAEIELHSIQLTRKHFIILGRHY